MTSWYEIINLESEVNNMKIEDINLTNDAKFLIATIYNSYLEKRKSGSLKRDSKVVGDTEDIQRTLMPQWPLDDVLDACFELRTKGLLDGIPGGDTLLHVQITNDGIAVMEVSFKDKVDTVLEYATKIKSLIPFI
jgi:hypothetical protein